MARHDQKGAESTFVCSACRDEECSICLDVLRSNYTMDRLCTCTRTDHNNALERAVAGERTRRRVGPGEPCVTCPKCGMTSYHPDDINTGYCGNCHKFTSDGRANNEVVRVPTVD